MKKMIETIKEFPKEHWKTFFKWQLFVVVVYLILGLVFISLADAANKKRKGPQWGDTICWYNSIKKPTCGTVGWSKIPEYARTLAKNKCTVHCLTPCKLVYCEKITRKSFAKNKTK